MRLGGFATDAWTGHCSLAELVIQYVNRFVTQSSVGMPIAVPYRDQRELRVVLGTARPVAYGPVSGRRHSSSASSGSEKILLSTSSFLKLDISGGFVFQLSWRNDSGNDDGFSPRIITDGLLNEVGLSDFVACPGYAGQLSSSSSNRK